MNPATAKPTIADEDGQPGGTYGDAYLRWKNWGQGSFGSPSAREIAVFDAELRKLDGPVAPAAKVLEIGFGNGAFLAYAKAKGWDTVGVEVSAELVEIARKAGFRAEHAHDLARFADDSFDLVVAFDVLEHIPQDALSAYLADVKRVLRDRGVLLARFPNGDSPFGLINQNGDVTHVTAIGSGKIRYFARRLDARLLYLGAEAVEIGGNGRRQWIRDALRLKAGQALNRVLNWLFYPGQDLAFHSPNLVVAMMFAKARPESRGPEED